MFSVPEVTLAACDQFLCGMFSRLESYCIAHMPTLLPVLPFLFAHTVALHLDIALNAYATGRSSQSGCLCSSTDPKP